MLNKSWLHKFCFSTLTAALLVRLAAVNSFASNRAIMEGLPATNNAILVSTGTSAATSNVKVQTLTVGTLTPNQCVQTTAGGVITTSGGQCNQGVAGSTTSLLAVYNGLAVSVSSPTSIISFSTANFVGSLTGSATANLELNPTVGAGQSFILSNPASIQTASPSISSETVVGSNIGNNTSVTGPGGSSAFHGAYLTVRSSGTTQGILVDSRGIVAGGAQNQIGAVTIRNDANVGPASTLLVLVDSTTDLQTGAGELEIWSNNTLHNDPIFWIHRTASNSSPEMRWDSPTPNMEMVCTSSDNAHGRGKWEPYATPFQGEILQVNSRAWDNTTFENIAYWEPLSIQPSVAQPGLYLRAQTLDNDSGVLASSTTSGVHFFSLNNHTVGIKGPLNVTASWDFMLPSTFLNGGQVLYQKTSATPFEWGFTTGGAAGQFLTFQGVGSAPTWTSASGSILTSSGVAFGSATSTVTSNTTNFTWDNTLNKLRLSGGPAGTALPLVLNNTGFAGTGAGMEFDIAGSSIGSLGQNGFNTLCADGATNCTVNALNFGNLTNITNPWSLGTDGHMSVGTFGGSASTMTVAGNLVVGTGFPNTTSFKGLPNSIYATGQIMSVSSATLGGISSTGHINTRMTAPSLSSCGSSPAISGSDNGGTITTGGGSVTGCTVTFQSSWANAPFCIAQSTWTTTASANSESTSSFVITLSATATNAMTIKYLCAGKD